MASRALATAFVNIVPGTADFEATLRSQLSGKTDSAGMDSGKGFNKGFGGALKGIGGILAGALATGAVINFTKSLINAAEAEVAGNKKLDTITNSMGLFGDKAGDVSKRLQDFATTQQLGIGVDDDVIKSAQAKLLTFGKLASSADTAGGAFDRATTLSMDMASVFGGDASSQAVVLGKALNDPVKGISALSRVGVTFTEDQKGMIKAMVEAGNVAGAQEIILKELETQVGGTAAATATGSDRMKQGWANLQETLGLTILPLFNSVAGVVADKLLPALTTGAEKLGGFFTSMSGMSFEEILTSITSSITGFISGGGLGGLVEGMLSTRQQIFDTLAATLPTIVTQLVSALTSALPSIIQGIIAMIPSLLQTAQTLFTSLITALGIIIPLLITEIAVMLPQIITSLMKMLPSIIKTALDLFMGILQGLLTALPNVIDALLKALPVILKALVSMLPGLIQGAIQLFLGLVNGLTTILPQLIDTLINDVLPTLIDTLTEMLPTLIDGAITLFLGLVDGISKALPEIIVAVIGMIPKIVDAIIKAIPKLVDAGFQLLKGLIKGIMDNAPRLIASTVKSLADGLIGGFKKLLGIKSPSRVFMGFGEDVGQGLVNGLKSMKTAVARSSAELGTTVKDVFANAIGDANPLADYIGLGFTNGNGSSVGAVRNPGMTFGEDALAGYGTTTPTDPNADNALGDALQSTPYSGDNPSSGFSGGGGGSSEVAPVERPIYADGIGLIGWVHEVANEEARLVFNNELGRLSRGSR